MPGDAQTLREYWTGHGHPGPSGGRFAAEIAWGTPGDFDRCVALVSEHGKMSPEQAKGYCNLRHHEATGNWPAQHAAQERGKMTTTDLDIDVDPREVYGRVRAMVKAFNPDQARVPSGPGGGEFGSGGGRAASPAAGSQHEPAHDQARSAHIAHLQHELHNLVTQLRGLMKQKQQMSRSGVRSFGTKPAVTSRAGTRKPAAPAKPGTTTSSSGTRKPGTKKPGSSKLASISAQIATVEGQIKDVQAQLRQALASKSMEPTAIHVEGEGDKDHDGDGLFDADGDGDGAVATRVKSVRNPRDVPSGRFRTFQGELKEAKQALAEGRINDVVDLLGSARALAQNDRERLVLGELQGSIGRVQHIQPDLTKSQAMAFTGGMDVSKVGPGGYIHGWIKVGEGTARSRGIRKGDSVAADRHDGSGTVVGIHNGADGRYVTISNPATGETRRVPHEAVRQATSEENASMFGEDDYPVERGDPAYGMEGISSRDLQAMRRGQMP